MLLLFASVGFYVSCSEAGPRDFEAKTVFVNRTETLFCLNSTSPEGRGGGLCSEVNPMGRSIWRPECDSSHSIESQRKGSVDVVLVEQIPDHEGQDVYGGTARCGEETEFRIERNGAQFVVTKTVTDRTSD